MNIPCKPMNRPCKPMKNERQKHMRTVSSKVSKREHAAIVQYANQAGESLSNLIRKVLKGQIKEIKLTLGWGGKPLTINDLTNRTRKESKMIREEESEEEESEEEESEEKESEEEEERDQFIFPIQ